MDHDIPTADLIDELQRLADELNDTPTMDDMRRSGAYSTTPYIDRFGTWNTALQEANIVERKKGRQTSREELITQVQQVADELGRVPNLGELEDKTRFSRTTYINYFGSWEGIVEAAGLDPRSER